MHSEWLEKQRQDIDLAYYQGLVTRDQRDERLDELGELATVHANRKAAIEYRRASDKNYRGICGFYGAAWAPDRDGYVFQKNSLDLGPLERDPRFLLGHNPDHQIGRIEDVELDSVGAFVTGRFDLKSRRGKDARIITRERLKRGKSVFASIGIDKGWTHRVSRRPNGLEVKSITRAAATEFSLVPYPMQPRAEFLFCT
jgi:hypothetical protein